MTPVLIELRALEKAGSISQLLAGISARHRFDRIELDRLRYMIREGRVTLLFDGFDELALRVGYDRAVDHLDTLIQAAEGNARIVVTSRTSHFENDRQVRMKLRRARHAPPGAALLPAATFRREQIAARVSSQSFYRPRRS